MHPLAVLALLSTALFAEPPARVLHTATDRLEVREPADPLLQADLRFTGTRKPYSAEVERNGLRVIGPGTFAFSGSMRPADNGGSPLVGLENGAILRFTGHLAGDGSNSRVSLDLRGKAHFLLAADAQTAFMNNAFFTRQLWIHGDGSGVFEIADGFVADRTRGGTVTAGIGSFRLSHMILRTHSTAGLPASPRHIQPLEGPNLNAHLVFENQGPCLWQTRSHPQTYSGGLWIGVDTVFETDTPLTHDGVTARWSDYTNPGAFQTTAENVTLTKRGDADLILRGEQGYLPGTRFRVEKGTLRLQSDAVGGTLRAARGKGAQELHLEIGADGLVAVETPALHLRSLTVDGELQLRSDQTLHILDVLDARGSLRISLHEKPAKGQHFTLFRAGEFKGSWTKLLLPDLPPPLRWDTRTLSRDGILRVD